MGTVHHTDSWKIVIYAEDHNPPHFHVKFSNGQETMIEIESFEVIAGFESPKLLRPVIAWARINRKKVESVWKELNP